MIKISQKIIDKAMNFVIRNNKRWGRYKLDKRKDIKRITDLIIKNGIHGILKSNQERYTASTVSGWAGQRHTDVIITLNCEYLEVIALINYWNLWGTYKNFFVIEE